MIKHNAPLKCKLRVALTGHSPSAMLCRCTLGCKKSCDKCHDCECYVLALYEEYREELIKRLEVGKKCNT